MFKLVGKRALIIGGSGGIGSAIAKVFHNAEATVLVVGTKEFKLNELCRELNDIRVHKLVFDLSETGKIQALVDQAIEILGEIDILVCSAGVTKDGLVIKMKEEDFDFVMDINLKASFLLNKGVIRHMLKRSSGRIINISSVVGHTGNAGQVNYCASKSGLEGMSRALAREVGSRGITINCIAPGFVETAMTDKLNDEQKERIMANIPLGKLGNPLDVAYAAIYLASEEARYVTGSTLHVNGGLFMN